MLRQRWPQLLQPSKHVYFWQPSFSHSSPAFFGSAQRKRRRRLMRNEPFFQVLHLWAKRKVKDNYHSWPVVMHQQVLFLFRFYSLKANTLFFPKHSKTTAGNAKFLWVCSKSEWNYVPQRHTLIKSWVACISCLMRLIYKLFTVNPPTLCKNSWHGVPPFRLNF